ncbi:hypothetical protein SAMN05880582_101408 [Rhizobium sp. RU20A]|uniref:biotin biosynthesis protein BioC n=1 Tax=Rhizobium sp. RU20A TaxID=1907412 RepID=UPI0009561AFC|nr:biotin biosynthesis protein BioC [Rhizobium sp. RU20A]SIQ01996.1 hypothetical protein SAMN05880582_101408 [Rhizobium sp. RU20A]
MQVDGRMIANAAAGDGRGNPHGRQAQPSAPVSADATAAAVAAVNSYLETPSRIQLSAEALLYLSRTRRAAERQPALTREEWSNALSPQLARREHQAFGRYSETGDYKAYYRAFIDYYDSLRSEDQNSLRYFGTREAAVAGLRSFEYSEESGSVVEPEFHRLVSVLLDSDKTFVDTPSPVSVEHDGTYRAWDTTRITLAEPDEKGSGVSEFVKLYSETF